MNTAELINNLLDRADGSLDHLKLHYGPLIRYVITPILHDERDREEVFSDILIRVWDRIDQYDPNSGSWTNWLSTISRNAAIDRVRRNPPVSAELTETIPAPNSNPEQELLRKERQRELYAALNSLDTSDKPCSTANTITDRVRRESLLNAAPRSGPLKAGYTGSSGSFAKYWEVISMLDENFDQLSEWEFDMDYSGYVIEHFPGFQREHPRLSGKFADTIEHTYSACSWMPDDRFQNAISAAVDEFPGTAPKVDIY